MEKSIADVGLRVDNVGAKVEQGFQAQTAMTHQVLKQAADVHLATMQMFQAMGAALTGGFTAIRDSSSRHAPALMPAAPALMPAPARHAICDAPPSESTERRTATTAAASSSESRVSEVVGSGAATGANIDLVGAFLAEVGVPVEGQAASCILGIIGSTPLTEHHKNLIRSIAVQTKDDAPVGLLFMLLTASEQFRAHHFQDFRTACATLLGANRTNTQATFSRVCQGMIAKNPTWEVKKSSAVKASNAILKEPTQHQAAFDALVANFKNPP
jgi:hypothetical protein